MVSLLTILAEDGVIDSTVEPAVIDLSTDDTYVVDLSDPKLDLSAFVVQSSEGEIALDELFAAAQSIDPGLTYDLGGTIRQKKHGGGLSRTCVVVLGVEVCWLG